MILLSELAWPLPRLAETLKLLAQHAGLKPVNTAILPSDGVAELASVEEIGHWLNWACARIGVEAESVETQWAELPNLVRNSTPVLLKVAFSSQQYGVLLLLKSGPGSTALIGPDGEVRHVPTQLILNTLAAATASPLLSEIRKLLSQAEVPNRQRPKVMEHLVRERIGTQRFEGCWMLRMPPATRFWAQLCYARVPHRLLIVLLVFAGVYSLEVLGWTLIGRGALNGNFDPGWLVAWVLLLVSMVPLHLCGAWLQGSFAIKVGTLLKQRLLSGALAMDVDAIRQQGSGKLLGQVIESQAFDSLILAGGLGALFALLELALAGWILALGAGGVIHACLLLFWLMVTCLVAWRYYFKLRLWTEARLALTDDLVERMVGHRTRLAQEPPERRHVDEDEMLEQFHTLSATFDRSFVPLSAGLPRGWLVIGLLGLVPDFVLGSAETVGLAIGLGGVLLAYRAFGETASGLASLTRAAVAWEYIAPLFNAAKLADNCALQPPLQFTDQAEEDDSSTGSEVLIQARDLVFRYSPQAEAVIKGCNLTLCRGDKVLLEGPSGSGKSTLAALLVGMRQPESGLLLLDGLDRASWGDNWRQLSTGAPQFHQNHVLAGTFAFNLLMGRCWPPSEADLAEAWALCVELGLDDLLSRMPAGLMQIVGETGWQLSHGERSRLYLARALLQKAKLIVLDESFAALDPDTLNQCLRCALEKAPSLMVIAHP